jgi:hypothetical protein
MSTRITRFLLAIMLVPAAFMAQTAAPGATLARSQDETVTLGYMRTVVNAEKNYKRKNGEYASSLAALVHSGSFTKRMAATDRGAYTVQFHGKATGYSLSLLPRNFAPDHRAFFVDDTGKIRVEEDKPATAESPLLK